METLQPKASIVNPVSFIEWMSTYRESSEVLPRFSSRKQIFQRVSLHVM